MPIQEVGEEGLVKGGGVLAASPPVHKAKVVRNDSVVEARRAGDRLEEMLVCRVDVREEEEDLAGEAVRICKQGQGRREVRRIIIICSADSLNAAGHLENKGLIVLRQIREGKYMYSCERHVKLQPRPLASPTPRNLPSTIYPDISRLRMTHASPL